MALEGPQCSQLAALLLCLHLLFWFIGELRLIGDMYVLQPGIGFDNLAPWLGTILTGQPVAAWLGGGSAGLL
jgi:hypothetical protein